MVMLETYGGGDLSTRRGTCDRRVPERVLTPAQMTLTTFASIEAEVQCRFIVP
jgi:hypothetical protein